MSLAAHGRSTTAPEGDGSPPAPLVVRPSRRKVRFDMAVTVLAALALGVMVLTTDRHDRSLVLDLIVFVYAPAAFGLQARRWRRLLAAGSLLEIGPAGVRVHHLGHGWLALPWAALDSVGPDSMFRTVVVKPAAGVDRSTPGTEWPEGRLVALRPRWWGFRVPLRFSDAAMGQVVAAVRHADPGRS